MDHSQNDVGVSKNSGTPKWMVYDRKPYFLMDDLGEKNPVNKREPRGSQQWASTACALHLLGHLLLNWWPCLNSRLYCTISTSVFPATIPTWKMWSKCYGNMQNMVKLYINYNPFHFSVKSYKVVTGCKKKHGASWWAHTHARVGCTSSLLLLVGGGGFTGRGWAGIVSPQLLET